MLLVNSPNNPTGWTLTRDEQQALLAHCRRTGTWIVADEVYERIVLRAGSERRCAPSFLDIAEPDDRLIVVHSFSKSFLDDRLAARLAGAAGDADGSDRAS